jgi:hypothetical protein
MNAAPGTAMTRWIALLIVLGVCGEAMGQPAIRGTSERQAQATKPDLTAGGGNSTVGASRAPDLPGDAKERFDALDLDGDGRVSLSEAAGHEAVVRHFDRADRNRDGRLTLAEFHNLGKKPPAAKKAPPRRPAATGRTARSGASSAGTSSASSP